MTSIQLETLQVASQVLHRMLALHPDKELLDTLRQFDLPSQWPDTSEMAQQGVTDIGRYLQQWRNEDAQLVALQLDYGKLFFGPGNPLAPPWGSYYLTATKLLNDTSTIELQRFLAKHDLKVQQERNEPVDHIATLLAVVAHLLAEMARAETIETLRPVMVELLQQHLLPWGAKCLALAEQHAGSEFYRGVARIGQSHLSNLSREFGI